MSAATSLNRAAPGDAPQRPSGTRRREPVPVDILLVPPVNVLVVTGPTGGKTVALKTRGLLPLLARRIADPVAENRQIPVPLGLRDIGDEQSIANSLSPFRAHRQHRGDDGALQTPPWFSWTMAAPARSDGGGALENAISSPSSCAARK